MAAGLNLLEVMGILTDDGGTHTLTSAEMVILEWGEDAPGTAAGTRPASSLLKVEVADTDTAYLAIDLEKMCWVDSLYIWAYNILSDSFWTIQTSPDNAAWTTTTDTGTYGSHRYWTVNTYCRYIRVRLNNTSGTIGEWWCVRIFAPDDDISWLASGGEAGFEMGSVVAYNADKAVSNTYLTMIDVNTPATSNGWLKAVRVRVSWTQSSRLYNCYVTTWRYLDGYYVCTGKSHVIPSSSASSYSGWMDAILEEPIWIGAGDFIGYTNYYHSTGYYYNYIGVSESDSGNLISDVLNPTAGNWYSSGNFESISMGLCCYVSTIGACIMSLSFRLSDSQTDGNVGDADKLWVKNIANRYGDNLVVDLAPANMLLSLTLATTETMTLFMDAATFWPNRGTVKIGSEFIEYWNKNSPNQLLSLTRGAMGSSPAEHDIGAAVTDWHDEVQISKDNMNFYGINDLSVAPQLTWSSIEVDNAVAFYARCNLITTEEINQEFRVKVIGYFTVPGV